MGSIGGKKYYVKGQGYGKRKLAKKYVKRAWRRIMNKKGEYDGR